MLLLTAPLMRTEPLVFSLVVSRWVRVTPGNVIIMPNMSRPLSVSARERASLHDVRGVSGGFGATDEEEQG